MEHEQDAILTEVQRISHVLNKACTDDPELCTKIEDAANEYFFSNRPVPGSVRPLVRGFVALEFMKENKTQDCMDYAKAVERQMILQAALARHTELQRKVSAWFGQNRPA